MIRLKRCLDSSNALSRRRWEHLFEYGDTTEDLKRAVKSEEQGNPCNDGLRSVCWKVRYQCRNPLMLRFDRR